MKKEDLVIGTNVKIATVAKNISNVNSPVEVEAEVSLSPTIVFPLITNDMGYYKVST